MGHNTNWSNQMARKEAAATATAAAPNAVQAAEAAQKAAAKAVADAQKAAAKAVADAEKEAAKAAKLQAKAEADAQKASEKAEKAAAKEAAKVAKAEARAAAKAAGGASNRYPGNAIITIVSPENPKRVGTASWDRFELYRNGCTVTEAKALGVQSGDINWDAAHNYISVAVPG